MKLKLDRRCLVFGLFVGIGLGVAIAQRPDASRAPPRSEGTHDAAARRVDAELCARDPKFATCAFAKSGLADLETPAGKARAE